MLSFILIGWAFFGEGTTEKRAWGVRRGEAVPEIQRTKTMLDLLFKASFGGPREGSHRGSEALSLQRVFCCNLRLGTNGTCLSVAAESEADPASCASLEPLRATSLTSFLYSSPSPVLPLCLHNGVKRAL